MTIRSTGLTIGFSSLLAALCFGCESEAPEVDEATPMETRELVAEIQLSDTHIVKFWDYGNGDAMIDETLHMDLDREAPLKLADMDMNGRTLKDTYALLAGSQADPAAEQRLASLDERVLERAASTVVTAEMEAMIEEDLERMPAGNETDMVSKMVETTDDRIQTHTSAVACAEPAWDWQGDVGWFKNNFCGADSKFCPTEWVWASYGWYRGPKWFKTTGFAQSHCSGASWLVKRRNYGGFPFYGISEHTLANFTLQPRHLDTQHWTTTGDRSWYAKVTSLTGSNRIALAVHHQ